jgi:hypothetical protein
VGRASAARFSALGRYQRRRCKRAILATIRSRLASRQHVQCQLDSIIRAPPPRHPLTLIAYRIFALV